MVATMNDRFGRKPMAQDPSELLEELQRARYRERSLEAALIRKSAELHASEAKVRRVQASLSWRATRPLRLVAKLLRSAKRLLSAK
jgi:hypothetical protein